METTNVKISLSDIRKSKLVLNYLGIFSFKDCEIKNFFFM